MGLRPTAFLALSVLLAGTSVVFGIVGLRTEPKSGGGVRIATFAGIAASLVLLAGFAAMVLFGLGVRWLLDVLEPWPVGI